MNRFDPTSRPLTRRQLLRRTGTGLGILGLAALLRDGGLMGQTAPHNPLAPRPPHFPGKAKSILHIYLNGGPSQVDTFDPKPLLKEYDGRPIPSGNLTTERPTGGALPSPFRFHRYG